MHNTLIGFAGFALCESYSARQSPKQARAVSEFPLQKWAFWALSGSKQAFSCPKLLRKEGVF
jgi:hypothetical protein